MRPKNGDGIVEIVAEDLADIPPILGERIRRIDGIESTTSLVTFPDRGLIVPTTVCCRWSDLEPEASPWVWRFAKLADGSRLFRQVRLY